MYQYSDGNRSSELDNETTSTVYCNNATIGQNVIGSTAELPTSRKNSNYSASSRGEDRRSDIDRNVSELSGVRTSRMSSRSNSGYPSGRRARRNVYDNSDTISSKSTESTCGSTCSRSSCSGSENSSSSGEPNLPYPGFPAVALRYLTQDARPRNWCLLLITNPWFERISILVILFNCITLGMYQPCVDDECVTNRCKILQVSWHGISHSPFALLISVTMGRPNYTLLKRLLSLFIDRVSLAGVLPSRWP